MSDGLTAIAQIFHHGKARPETKMAHGHICMYTPLAPLDLNPEFLPVLEATDVCTVSGAAPLRSMETEHKLKHTHNMDYNLHITHAGKKNITLAHTLNT